MTKSSGGDRHIDSRDRDGDDRKHPRHGSRSRSLSSDFTRPLEKKVRRASPRVGGEMMERQGSNASVESTLSSLSIHDSPIHGDISPDQYASLLVKDRQGRTRNVVGERKWMRENTTKQDEEDKWPQTYRLKSPHSGREVTRTFGSEASPGFLQPLKYPDGIAQPERVPMSPPFSIDSTRNNSISTRNDSLQSNTSDHIYTYGLGQYPGDRFQRAPLPFIPESTTILPEAGRMFTMEPPSFDSSNPNYDPLAHPQYVARLQKDLDANGSYQWDSSLGSFTTPVEQAEALKAGIRANNGALHVPEKVRVPKTFKGRDQANYGGADLSREAAKIRRNPERGPKLAASTYEPRSVVSERYQGYVRNEEYIKRHNGIVKNQVDVSNDRQMVRLIEDMDEGANNEFPMPRTGRMKDVSNRGNQSAFINQPDNARRPDQTATIITPNREAYPHEPKFKGEYGPPFEPGKYGPVLAGTDVDLIRMEPDEPLENEGYTHRVTEHDNTTGAADKRTAYTYQSRDTGTRRPVIEQQKKKKSGSSRRKHSESKVKSKKEYVEPSSESESDEEPIIVRTRKRDVPTPSYSRARQANDMTLLDDATLARHRRAPSSTDRPRRESLSIALDRNRVSNTTRRRHGGEDRWQEYDPNDPRWN